jgi:hypothetical protein
MDTAAMTQDFQIYKNALSQEMCEFLALEFKMMEEVCKILFPDQSLTDNCKNSFARYSPLMFEALSIKLQPLIEKLVSCELWPVYSYARIYYTGSELERHRDRPSSEFSVSICIEKDQSDWPLHIQDHRGIDHAINLEVGDLVVYSGRELMHWRDPLVGSKQIQVFLQYVNKAGDSSWLKYDTRPALGLPFEYVSDEIKNQISDISRSELFNQLKDSKKLEF